MRFTIARKLTVSFLAVALLLGIISSFAIYTMFQVDDSYTDLLGRRATILSNSKDIKSLTVQQMSSVRDYLLTQSPDALKMISDSSKKVEELVGANIAMVQRDDDHAALIKLSDMNKSFSDKVAQVVTLLKTDAQAALRQANSDVIPLGREMQTVAEGIVTGQQQLMDQGSADNTVSVQKAQNTLLYVSLVGFAIAILLGVVLARVISKPLVKISHAAKLISEGDLTQEEIQVKSKDEVGDLTQSFNLMTKNLRTLIHSVASSAELVSATAEELTSNTEQTNSATETVAATMQEIAAGSQDQEQMVMKSVQAITNMSSSVQNIASNTHHVSLSSQQTAEMSMEGNDVIQQAILQMNSMQGTIAELAEMITHLGAQSNEIGHIVEVISGIAGQTNLLALNAAIEAARAGEQGKGFAVVADEVRKLAEQSSQSAQQIAELVSSIQSNTHQAVGAMAKGTSEVTASIEVVTAAGASFANIHKSVSGVSEQIQAVASSTEEMAANADQVANTIDRIAEIASLFASRTQNVSAASEEQLASMEEISTAATQLTEMAVDLQLLIGKFRV